MVKKWVWINSAYYLDDITFEETKNIILNLKRKDFKVMNDVGNIINN